MKNANPGDELWTARHLPPLRKDRTTIVWTVESDYIQAADVWLWTAFGVDAAGGRHADSCDSGHQTKADAILDAKVCLAARARLQGRQIMILADENERAAS